MRRFGFEWHVLPTKLQVVVSISEDKKKKRSFIVEKRHFKFPGGGVIIETKALPGKRIPELSKEEESLVNNAISVYFDAKFPSEDATYLWL